MKTNLKKKVYLFFWIDWISLNWKNKSTNYLFGIYLISLSNISKLIDNGAPEHSYIRRVNDIKGNAKSSYLLNLKNFHKIYEKLSRNDVNKSYLT